MPQMAPMTWTLLAIMFIMCLLIIIMLNYFSFQPKVKITECSLQLKNSHWKW